MLSPLTASAGKSPAANKSLTDQFTSRQADKTYTLLVPLPRGAKGGGRALTELLFQLPPHQNGESGSTACLALAASLHHRLSGAAALQPCDAAVLGLGVRVFHCSCLCRRDHTAGGSATVTVQKDGWVLVQSFIRRQGDVYVSKATGGRPDEATTQCNAILPPWLCPCIVPCHPLNGT